MVNHKGDGSSGRKHPDQNAGNIIQPPVAVEPTQIRKEPAGDIARQKKLLLFHRSLQQITDAGNADDNRDDVKIVEHG